jgi:hypothetical protein
MHARTHCGGKQKTPGVGVGAKKAGRLLKKKEGRLCYLAQQKIFFKNTIKNTTL